MRIFQVDSVEIQVAESDPPQAVITVHGTATTPGWTNVRLDPLEKTLSADGIFDLELVGEPPDGIVPQVLTGVMASFVLKKDVERLVGVKVDARTNSVTQLLQHVLQASAGRVAGPAFTTFAVGEETPTTLALGEEGGPVPTTLALGEEGGPTPTTLALGEEGGPIPTTLRFGEEGGPKTAFIAEENPKTVFGGEEGPKTAFFQEEGPKTAAISEEGKPAFGETDPRVDDPKPPFGEGFDLGGFRNPFGQR